MDKYEKLRQKHPEFVYESYEIHEDGFVFHFSIGEYKFNPRWSFDKSFLGDKIDDESLSYAVFCLGMTELISYWKCSCPPIVRVKCGALNDELIKWWKVLYFGGLGEFFYQNKISTDFEHFMTIIPDNKVVKFFSASDEGNGFLIPVGGGKDSIVTLELLRDYQDQNLCYIINPRSATLDCAKMAGYGNEKIVGVTRTIDKQLLELNKMEYLNGHTPLSAIIAFSSWIFAFCLKKKYIALSNESSANEGNVIGSKINHQYSKSTQFESDFREFITMVFGRKPEYFSLLRPWSEWQITKRFVTFPQYFPVFQSCNVGSKTNVWCADCAKCLYVYIMLSAFLPDSQLLKIFGNNMLNDVKYRDMFNSLISPEYDKPFECVGTRHEVNLALASAARLRKNQIMPLLLDEYMKKCVQEFESLDMYFDENNFVPAELLPLLRNYND